MLLYTTLRLEKKLFAAALSQQFPRRFMLQVRPNA